MITGRISFCFSFCFCFYSLETTGYRPIGPHGNEVSIWTCQDGWYSGTELVLPRTKQPASTVLCSPQLPSDSVAPWAAPPVLTWHVLKFAFCSLPTFSLLFFNLCTFDIFSLDLEGDPSASVSAWNHHIWSYKGAETCETRMLLCNIDQSCRISAFSNFRMEATVLTYQIKIPITSSVL